MKASRLATFAVLCAPALAAPPDGDVIVTPQALWPTPPGVQVFQMTADVSGDTAVVGAATSYFDDEAPPGAVLVYERLGSDWVPTQTLAASDASNGDAFGFAVDLEGDRLAVGAPGLSAAYVFERVGGSWVEVAKLTPERTTTWFGMSISLDGSRVAVGAPYWTPPQSWLQYGAAYVFAEAGGVWELEDLIPGSATGQFVHFGANLDLEGDRLGVVSDHWMNLESWAYLYERSPSGNWVEQWEFQEDGLRSIAIQGDTIVVGQPHGSSQGMTQHGELLVFERSGDAWPLMQRLVHDEAEAWDNIGWSVDLEGDLLVAGPEVGMVQPRMVIAWRRTGLGWSRVARLHPAAQAESSIVFATVVATDGERVVANGNGWQGGSASLYDAPGSLGSAYCFGDGGGAPCPCGNEDPVGPAGGCASSSGEGAVLALGGTASLALDDLVVSAWDVPGETAVLFAGTAQGPETPFGDGLRCIGGSLQSFGVAPVRLSRRWGPGLAGQAGWAPGDTAFLQVLFRDEDGPCGTTFNTTGAYRLTIAP